jgi:hypothetical protein
MPRDNLITIRTGSGTPSAASFATGEPAFDPAAGRLWIKGSSAMVEIGGSSAVVEADTPASFPATGSAGTLYVSVNDSRLYRWDASGFYVEIAAAGGALSVLDGGTYA